jgi:hypothetical protein
MHSVCTQANAVKFVHQLLCNPKISSLLKALQKGFLKGCPNINEELVTKYLNPRPATAKGHMKRPEKGIRSTQPKQGAKTSKTSAPKPQTVPKILLIFDEPSPYNRPAYKAQQNVHMIPDDELIVNIFLF